MNAEIITIGDEILIGQVIDTNSAFIAQALNEIGIDVARITSVSDKIIEITNALDESSRRTKLVLITGGLGPTNDDRTKNAIKEFFNSQLIVDQEVLNHIGQLLSSRGVNINELNIEQAKVPDNCKIIHNRLGTAPGLWFEKDHTTFIFMPGVPFEMKGIMEDILANLKIKYGNPSIVHKTILTHGIAESALAKLISGWESNLPEFLSLAYLPSPGMVRLRITGRNALDNNLDDIMNESIIKLKHLISDYIFGYDSDSLEKVVGTILFEKHLLLSTAESCTGGTIASIITSVPGCSRYYAGSVVAYSNDIKTKILNIDSQLIINYGAVSREVAESMAAEVRKLFNSDYSIATTGIAGPEGGTAEKPVGTVWIAVAGPDGISSQLLRFGDERNRNIYRTAYAALFQLRKKLLSTNSS